MKKYKITEIFHSIQGEGLYTGTPMVFIRFAGCNLRCSWCDTDHDSRMELTAEEIRLEADKHPSNIICFTGGEPFLQIDRDLIGLLRKAKYRLHCETNGTINEKDNPDFFYITHGFEWITVSPKSTKTWKLYSKHCVKIIDGPRAKSLIEEANKRVIHYRYLQPLDPGNAEGFQINMENTALKVMKMPGWRLSLQTHKIIGIQ